MEVERMAFEDGSWWEFGIVLTHGASRKIQMALRQFLKAEGPLKLAMGGNDAGKVLGDVGLDWERFDPSKANDAMLLSCTTQWSFGPVTADVMDGIPEAYCERVLGRMNVLYGAANPLSVEGPKS